MHTFLKCARFLGHLTETGAERRLDRGLEQEILLTCAESVHLENDRENALPCVLMVLERSTRDPVKWYSARVCSGIPSGDGRQVRLGWAMKKWAFTLIEQLTAVAIIGVLAAIAVPNFMNAQIRAKIAKSQSGLRTYQTIQRMYLLEVGDIPRSY